MLRALVLAAVLLGASLTGGVAREFRGFRDGAPGEFDFYVLALSWSPGFCELDGDRRGSPQCEPGQRLGFVVHGLWPQYARGYPSDCGRFERPPSRMALDEARDLYPDMGLARHEWRQHGTCSGLGPAEYFRAVRQARDRVRIPEGFRQPSTDQAMLPAEIERAFAAANPGLRPDMMAVVCRRRVLQEVRICLDRDLRAFRRCPEVDGAGCGFGEISVSGTR